MHFLCNTIDLKQSVELTLKVQGKSLATVLDEVHFIVNLHCFPLPLVPQANHSFPKVSHLPPPRQNNFQNSPPPFSLSKIPLPSCQSEQNSKVLISTIFLQDQSRGQILSYFYKLCSALSLSAECLLNFLSNFYLTTM